MPRKGADPMSAGAVVPRSEAKNCLPTAGSGRDRGGPEDRSTGRCFIIRGTEMGTNRGEARRPRLGSTQDSLSQRELLVSARAGKIRQRARAA
ncbi:MAG: hypothetical protein M2R45_03000 [Verrucomicrobia subdivision 3 bacterium]|nr:hypothetical protein [Limisphaerales bacterium]